MCNLLLISVRLKVVGSFNLLPYSGVAYTYAVIKNGVFVFSYVYAEAKNEVFTFAYMYVESKNGVFAFANKYMKAKNRIFMFADVYARLKNILSGLRSLCVHLQDAKARFVVPQGREVTLMGGMSA